MVTRNRFRVLCFTVSVLLVTAGVLAASSRLEPPMEASSFARAGSAVPGTQAETQSEPGAWVPWEVGFPTAGNAQNGAWEKQLLAIAAVIRESPALSDLRGFFPGLSGSNGTPVNWKGPIFGNLIFSAWWPKAIERTPDGRAKIKKTWEYNRPSGMNLRVNSFPTFGGAATWMEDELGRFFPQPEVRREIAGFSVYGDWLVITRPGKVSVFSPVSQERVLRAYIKYLQPRAQDFDKMLVRSKQEYADFTSPEGREKRRRHIEEIVAKLADPRIAETERRQAEARDRRREEDLRKAANPAPGDLALYATNELKTAKALLDGMSEADRRAPAWHRPDPKHAVALVLVPAGSPGARPIAELNRGFFDTSLPRTAMQIVAVNLDPFESQVRAGAREPQARVPLAVAEQTDWKRVAALLK
jgi:hypothetical protein